MTKTIDALVEALEVISKRCPTDSSDYKIASVGDTARAALAQARAEQAKPVAWGFFEDGRLCGAQDWESPPQYVTPLYTTPPAAPVAKLEPSPTTGMNVAQRILHVGGRNNAAGYVEFGSIQAVEALIQHALRDAKPATS